MCKKDDCLFIFKFIAVFYCKLEHKAGELIICRISFFLCLKQKLEIDLNGNGNLYTCEVLDCDTINQVKSKCLYQIYKNKPASEMPSTDEVDLGRQRAVQNNLGRMVVFRNDP